MIEIDGVVRRLEQPVTEAGDYIADTYVAAIDLSTAPQPLNHKDTERLASAIRRLNRNLASTSLYLYTTESAEVYDAVIDQLNTLNQDSVVGQLLPLMDKEASFADSSPHFKFHNSHR